MVSTATLDEPAALTCEGVTIDFYIGSAYGLTVSTATVAFPTFSTITGKYIKVSGTFTVDKSLRFVDCMVFFDEDAEMVTSGTVDLEGVNTDFTNCEDKAWKSIQITEDGAIRLDGCRIHGAMDQPH